jgi:Reverse transcriptase (RNA-dependent DNA polymerase)
LTPQAVHVAQEYIDAYCQGGDTAYIAALDIAKAFPRVNHDAVLIKLFTSKFPRAIIDLLSHWFERSFLNVKWFDCISNPFTLRTGVNQGSVLAPFIFAPLVDDVISKCITWQRYDSGIIIVYADDILLYSYSPPSAGLHFVCADRIRCH